MREVVDLVVPESAKVVRAIGRPRLRLRLAEADRLRSEGKSWGYISRTLGVHRNTLLNHRKGTYSERSLPVPQKKLLKMASRFLQANLGDGLTPLEFKDAQALVRLLRSLATENADLKERLAKARLAIKTYERMIADVNAR